MGREAPAVPRPRQCGRAATLETAVRERGPAAPKPNLLASYRQHCAWGDALPEDGARRHRRCFDFKLGFQWAWLCVFAALTASRLSFLCAAHAPPTRALITYIHTHTPFSHALSLPPPLSFSLFARAVFGAGSGEGAITLRGRAKVVLTFMRLIDVSIDDETEHEIEALFATF